MEPTDRRQRGAETARELASGLAEAGVDLDTHVADVVRANLLAMGAPIRSEAVNIGGGVA